MARNEHGRRIIEVIYQAELIADCRALAEPWGRQQQFCIFLLPLLPSSSSSWQHINYDWLGSSEATKLPTIAAKLLWRNVSQSKTRNLAYSNYDDFPLHLFRFVAWQLVARALKILVTWHSHCGIFEVIFMNNVRCALHTITVDMCNEKSSRACR